MKQQIKQPMPCILLFGATGDLARKKIVPALQRLYLKKKLGTLPILCIGRRAITKEAYLDLLGREKLDKGFSERLMYLSLALDTADPLAFGKQVLSLEKTYGCKGGRVFYFSLSPSLLKKALTFVHQAGLTGGAGRKKAVFEKPFGDSMPSSQELEKAVAFVFDEKDVFRMDHYLGKELVQNILTFRFANTVFEKLWHSDFIDHVQITLAESIGVETRGEYYDQVGAIKDMVQSHILQVLSLIAMEHPKSLAAKDVQDEKLKVLMLLEPVKDLVIGQYTAGMIDGQSIKGYLEEEKINPKSQTETYIAFKVFIKNKRWNKVPFYVRTGKRLQKKYSEINLVLKPVQTSLFSSQKTDPNIISIRINPQEGIALRFYAKTPGNKNGIHPVNMEFCHNCEFGPDSPEAYETLLSDILLDDHTLFTRKDEVVESWKFTDDLIKTAKKGKVYFYEAGTFGPKEADKLIENDGRKWIIVERKLST